MPWVKFSDNTPTHPKIIGLSDHALACWFRSLCYSAHHLTDGHIPNQAASTLTKKRGVWNELEQAGLIRFTPTGYEIHDYTEYQPTRAQVETERAAWRERQRKARAS